MCIYNLHDKLKLCERMRVEAYEIDARLVLGIYGNSITDKKGLFAYAIEEAKGEL